ncbi:amidohydrolase family protein [Solibacillus sp. FSL R5-0449]|uniref:amidohydrolase family protein n=1 Tax=Solibacillus sp. FSL R5-0449 TaxID=2921639 RepID=UPI0030D267A2
MKLLKNGFVVNMETGDFTRQDVYIENNKIVKVAPNLQLDHVEVMDCTDKWLIPGLIDMHVHIKKHFANYFTAAGITTVRNTAGSIIELKPFIDANGSEMEPRVISADRMIDGPPGLWGDDTAYNINVDNADLARQEVARQIELGTHFIKVYGWLDPEYMKVVVEEARKHNLEVSSDIIYSKKVDALLAADIGIDWLEHCSGIIQAMYPQWTMDAPKEIWDTIPWDQPDEELITNICKQLLKKDIKLCPTIVLYDQMRLADQYWTINHEIVDHMENSDYLFKHWPQAAHAKQGQATLGIQTKTIQKIAYTYYKMGGTVVTGTDTPAGIYTYPGFALHRELQLFVDAGFTPVEALQQATINAAKALKIADLGDIKEGFIADLLVLNENPLIHIENTMKIDQIVKDGEMYTIPELLGNIPTEQEMNDYISELIKTFEQQGLYAGN